MRRLVATSIVAVLGLFAVHDSPDAKASEPDATQTVVGEIDLPLVDGYKSCNNLISYEDRQRRNGTVGFDFAVEPQTRGQPFILEPGEGMIANLDILFWSGKDGIKTETGYSTARLGGEHGLVPPNAKEAWVCLAEGAKASFRYQAGRRVAPPSLVEETRATDHAGPLRLIGRAPSPHALRRLVFQGNYAIATSRSGMSIFRLLDRYPYLRHLSYLHCPGGVNSADVSVWGNYVFLSVPDEYPYFALDPVKEYNGYESNRCNSTDHSVTKAGIRIIDISDPEKPRQVKFFETPCGTWNHTLIPHQGRLYIYAPIPCDEDTEVVTPAVGPIPERAWRPLTFQIRVIRFDPKDPDRSRVVGTPELRGESEGQMGCHDITVFPARALAACVQFFNDAGKSSLLDISDPANPKVTATLETPEESSWMSYAAFTWDGEYLVLSDSDRATFASGDVNRCHGQEDNRPASVWVYDVKDQTAPRLVADFMLPRMASTPGKKCAPWEINMVPTTDPTQRLAVIGWFTGGMNVIDLSDPSHPQELAHWQPPARSEIMGSYFYNGRLYSVEHWSGSGIRVFELDGFGPNDTWSYSSRMNPQTQLLEFRN